MIMDVLALRIDGLICFASNRLVGLLVGWLAAFGFGFMCYECVILMYDFYV